MEVREEAGAIVGKEDNEYWLGYDRCFFPVGAAMGTPTSMDTASVTNYTMVHMIDYCDKWLVY